MTEEIERWADIPGHPDWQASTLGNVRNKHTGKLRPLRYHFSRHQKEYLKVNLGPKHHGKLVHRLILMAFIGLPEGTHVQAGHIDDDGFNNRLENLHWVTHLENQHEKLCDTCRDPYSQHDPSGVCHVEHCMCAGWKVRQRKHEDKHEDSIR